MKFWMVSLVEVLILALMLTAVSGVAQVPAPAQQGPSLGQPAEEVPSPAAQTTAAAPEPMRPPATTSSMPALPNPALTKTQIPIVTAAPAAAATTAAPVVALQSTTYLTENAKEFPQIFRRLISRGMSDRIGHSMAVSMMTNCLIGTTPEAKADALVDMYNAVVTRGFTSVQTAWARLGRGIVEPQLSVLAATLVCKQGSRTAVEMVDALHGAAVETQAAPYGVIGPSLPNLFVAANMMY